MVLFLYGLEQTNYSLQVKRESETSFKETIPVIEARQTCIRHLTLVT